MGGTSSTFGELQQLVLSSDINREASLAHAVQYLVNSGQMFSLVDGDAGPVHSPKAIACPDTKQLDKSAFKLITSSASEISRNIRCKSKPSITKLICSREQGLSGGRSFSSSERCWLMNNFLPNYKKQILNLDTKVFCVSYTQDGNRVLTASQDKKLRIYDNRRSSLQLIKTIVGRNVGWSILDTAISPDGKYIAYSSWADCLNICPIEGDSDNQQTLRLASSDRGFCVFSLVFSSDGKEILSGANDGCIYLYDRGSDQRVFRIHSHHDDVNSVSFADDTSQIIYSGGDDGFLKVWDRRTLSDGSPSPVGILAGHMDGVTYIEPKGDGRYLLSNSKDQSIKLWDVRRLSGKNGRHETRKAVNEQSWDYRWQGVPKSLQNPTKKLKGDSSVMTYCGHSVMHTLCRCHFSPLYSTGQRYIYTGCGTGRVVIYDTLTGTIKTKLSGHRATVRDVAWHPYQPELISSSWDCKIIKWAYSEDVVNGRRRNPKWIKIRQSERIKNRRDRSGAATADSSSSSSSSSSSGGASNADGVDVGTTAQATGNSSTNVASDGDDSDSDSGSECTYISTPMDTPVSVDL